MLTYKKDTFEFIKLQFDKGKIYVYSKYLTIDKNTYFYNVNSTMYYLTKLINDYLPNVLITIEMLDKDVYDFSIDDFSFTFISKDTISKLEYIIRNIEKTKQLDFILYVLNNC